MGLMLSRLVKSTIGGWCSSQVRLGMGRRLNSSLMIESFTEDPRLCYSIREQICVGVWPNPKGFESRDFATNLYIKSRCIDASKSANPLKTHKFLLSPPPPRSRHRRLNRLSLQRWNQSTSRSPPRRRSAHHEDERVKTETEAFA
jgi:hypothetical protein